MCGRVGSLKILNICCSNIVSCDSCVFYVAKASVALNLDVLVVTSESQLSH